MLRTRNVARQRDAALVHCLPDRKRDLIAIDLLIIIEVVRHTSVLQAVSIGLNQTKAGRRIGSRGC